MKLTKNEMKRLETRFDRALRCKSYKAGLRAMGNCINIDLKKLPPPLRRKWRKVIVAITTKAFTG